MSQVIGLIPAFQEEGNIGPAVRSLFSVGCHHVVVLDGAYAPLQHGGGTFMGGGPRSTDGTMEEAEEAGARVVVPGVCLPFGTKRAVLLAEAGAEAGDHVLFLDADERAVGTLPEHRGHACIRLHNHKPNDLPGLRRTWPHGDYGPVVPLLRYLEWTPDLCFTGVGRFEQGGEHVVVYEDSAPVLPVLDGIRIDHVAEATAERVAEKRRYYGARLGRTRRRRHG